MHGKKREYLNRRRAPNKRKNPVLFYYERFGNDLNRDKDNYLTFAGTQRDPHEKANPHNSLYTQPECPIVSVFRPGRAVSLQTARG